MRVHMRLIFLKMKLSPMNALDDDLGLGGRPRAHHLFAIQNFSLRDPARRETCTYKGREELTRIWGAHASHSETSFKATRGIILSVAGSTKDGQAASTSPRATHGSTRPDAASTRRRGVVRGATAGCAVSTVGSP